MNGAYEGLRLAARAAKPDDNDDNTPDDDCSDGKDKKDKDKMDKTHTQADVDNAVAEASAVATKAANDRFAAVLASEHYAGREDLAKNLLGTAALDADGIIAALAAAPKPTQASELSEEDKRKAAEEAGRAEMRDQLNNTANSNVDPNGSGSEQNKAKTASAVWDSAIANEFPQARK